MLLLRRLSRLMKLHQTRQRSSQSDGRKNPCHPEPLKRGEGPPSDRLRSAHDEGSFAVLAAQDDRSKLMTNRTSLDAPAIPGRETFPPAHAGIETHRKALGAMLLSPSRCQFRVWAPSHEQLEL